ncbi:Gfo/Idh/MocA family oxidoreductase [uncultured Sunxiuqinia sp.]|uniref:Gfo/Idh/MocA family protein n=1 Tax=uncultured Sunxiuqinia sp. TaxID=1573825 RepID=UPI0026182799|nr:Gfo/Idh/MocA family oxidoreductase [uncultured Sunxiuqinia sp.]
MKKQYNWAILGCGKIARKFAEDLKLLPNAKLYAAASRSLNRAQEFASQLGFEKAYGSYNELVEDPQVDIVYIATPHSHHHEHALLCLTHQKAVLCEKAFAMNAREAREMIDCAKRNNTFLMEAFWTRFQPGFLKAMEILQSGKLGQLKMVRSDFAFNAEKNADLRLYNIDLGGGSLLDIGIYPVFAALMTLGKPETIQTLPQFSFTNSEESILMSFKYANGAMASLVSSFASHSSIQSEFWCEKGYLRLNRRWFANAQICIWQQGMEHEEPVEVPPIEGKGYQFEAAHVMKCLDEGRIESDMMTFAITLDLMDTLDRVRADAGIVYPQHDFPANQQA